MSTAFGATPAHSEFFRNPGRTVRRKARKQSRWSEEELTILRDNAHLGSRALTEKLPGRTQATIAQMAYIHKIPLKWIHATGYKRSDMRGNLTPPKGAAPAVVALFEQIARLDTTMTEVEAKAGLSGSVINRWRHTVPRYNNLIAALNAVGLDLAVVPLNREGKA